MVLSVPLTALCPDSAPRGMSPALRLCLLWPSGPGGSGRGLPSGSHQGGSVGGGDDGVVSAELEWEDFHVRGGRRAEVTARGRLPEPLGNAPRETPRPRPEPHPAALSPGPLHPSSATCGGASTGCLGRGVSARRPDQTLSPERVARVLLKPPPWWGPSLYSWSFGKDGPRIAAQPSPAGRSFPEMIGTGRGLLGCVRAGTHAKWLTPRKPALLSLRGEACGGKVLETRRAETQACEHTFFPDLHYFCRSESSIFRSCTRAALKGPLGGFHGGVTAAGSSVSRAHAHCLGAGLGLRCLGPGGGGSPRTSAGNPAFTAAP